MDSEKKFNLGTVATRLEEARGSTDGRPSFSAFDFERCLAILETAVPTDGEIVEHDWRELLYVATRAAASRGAITAQNLKSAIERQRRTHLALPQKKYFLATTLSIDPGCLHRRVLRSGTCHFTFRRDTPSRFVPRKLVDAFERAGHHPTPAGYTTVLGSIEARSKHEAATRIIDELDFSRSLWNFGLNRLVLSHRSYGAPSEPLNKIRLGQVHTLHWGDGTLVDNSLYWYDSHFTMRSNPQHLPEQWKTMPKLERELRSKINRSNYQPGIKSAFIRYCRALDSFNFEFAFLQLWGLLELLTGTVNARYDETINRTLFLSTDIEFDRQILEHLRTQRNRSVHNAAMSSESESLVHQLKVYVEGALIFHVNHGHEFDSMGAAAAFLDHPKDSEQLRLRASRARSALRFREAIQENVAKRRRKGA